MTFVKLDADYKFLKLKEKNFKIYDEFILINKETFSKYNNISNLFRNNSIFLCTIKI